MCPLPDCHAEGSTAVGYQFYCTQGPLNSYADDESIAQALQADGLHDRDLGAGFFPGCGNVGEPMDSFSEANSVVLSHNQENPSHGGSVDQISGPYQYVCETSNTSPEPVEVAAAIRMYGLPEHLRYDMHKYENLSRVLYPGCGAIGTAFSTWQEANQAGLAHVSGNDHGGAVYGV